MNRVFPKLYKTNSNGSLQEWTISVEPNHDGTAFVTTRWGVVGGAIQETQDLVKAGKNIGRSNETTAFEQACLEAEADWTKHKDKGYAEAPDGDLSKIKTRAERVAAGSIEPMLAEKWRDVKDSLSPELEVIAQVKINGLRCVAKKNGSVVLYTRGGKTISTVPHVVAELDRVMKPGDTWDGELCTEDCKPDADTFQKTVGAVRKKEPNALSLQAFYHIFDNMTDDVRNRGWYDRIARVVSALCHTDTRPGSHLRLVQSHVIKVKDVAAYEQELTAQGYEGAIVRLMNAPYENKRTKSLLKVKTFIDDEFELVDVEEGRGTRSGMAGRVIVRLPDGRTNEAGIKGSHESAIMLLKNKAQHIGKKCTVRYFGLTGEGKLYLPVFYGMRESE